MSSTEQNEKTEKSDLDRVQESEAQAPDAQEARLSAKSDIELALNLNPNKHSGSAGGDDMESIQIVALDPKGKEQVIAERPKGEGSVKLFGRVEKHDSTDAGLQAFKDLSNVPLEKQIQIIGLALSTGLDQYLIEQRQRTLGSIVGTVEGVGHIAEGFAKIADFGAALILGDNERAGQMGAEFGQSVGEAIVSGVRLFQASEAYLNELGASGDFSKPFRDLAIAGSVLNERWSQLPPFEQERLKSQIATELIGNSLFGMGAKGAISKAKTYTEVLDSVTEQAIKHGIKKSESVKKAAKAIATTIDDMLQPEYALPGGGKIKFGQELSESAKKSEHFLKMVGRSGEHIPSKKPLFLAPGKNKILNEAEMDACGGVEKLKSLSDGELASIGLKRFELPKMRLDKDEFSIKATIPGDNRAWFHAEPSTEGTLLIRHVDKGSLPFGAGAHFAAEALQAHDIKDIKKVILHNIIHPDSVRAYKAGELAENTYVAKHAAKMLKQLGIIPISFKYQEVGSSVNIIIETGR
ncbi:MAG: hypothetical protein SFY67_06320 [Candidatus Melainabacteria bacterium]|nr:hypothetical protein [Candidatus Melainabacteria bacterium]